MSLISLMVARVYHEQHPRLSQNLLMEPTRGIRGSDSRSLRDGTPNQAYIVEWATALQVDSISGGSLGVKMEDLKKVQSLKKSYAKFYCTFSNPLASQLLCISTC